MQKKQDKIAAAAKKRAAKKLAVEAKKKRKQAQKEAKKEVCWFVGVEVMLGFEATHPQDIGEYTIV